MAKKKSAGFSFMETVGIIVYWAIYLTLTMAFFERFNITPETVPFGVIGWMMIVELPRVFIGFLIHGFFYMVKRKY
jgi:hypothetical protein